MAETYDIASPDQDVKWDPDLYDSAGTGLDPYDTAEEAMRQIPAAEPVDEPTPSPTPATLSAAENVPAPIPPPDPLPFLDEESSPSEADLEDAWVKLQPNGGLAPEEAKKYGDTLRRGAEDQKNRDLAKAKENIKAQYRTPDGVLQMSKDPTIRREMDASPDDDLVTKRALNRAYLASMYNRPNASPEELDILMRAHAITHWGLNNPSHETFYTKTKEDVLKSDEEEKVSKSLTNNVVSTILEDQLAGKQSSFGESFEKFAAANPKVITAQNKDQWYQRALLVDERVRKLGESVRFPAASLIDLSQKVMAGTATELDYDRATNALRGINPKDLTQVMKVAALAVREKDPKGEMISTMMSNIGKRFSRDLTLTKVNNRYQDNLIGDQFQKLKDGWTVGKDAAGRLAVVEPGRPLPPGAVPVSDEEYKAYWNDLSRSQDAMRIGRQIQQFQETVADPIVPVFEGGLLGAAEAGVYDIAGFSKLLPLGLIPGPGWLAGGAVTFAMVGASTYHDVRLENPNLDQQAANAWANLDGLVNAVGMKFKGDFLLGHYPMFKTMRQLKGLGKTTEALKVYARWAAVHNIEENFEELAQDTTSAVIAKLYGDAHPKEVKQQSWEKLLIDIAKTRPQVAMAVGPLSLIGAGSATVRDLKNPMRDFMNPDALKSVGLSDEKIAEILASKDLDEAGKIFRKHYNTLTKEDLKRGFEYAAGLTEKDDVDAAMADPAMPTIDPVVMPDGTYKYNVLSPDGTILSTHTDPDVAETAWVRETERVKGENWAAEKNAAAQQAAAEAAAAASDEGVAKEAEAKAEAETVSPEDRLGTAMTVEFEENAAPTPEESREIAQLQAEVRAAGRGDTIVLARPSNTQTGPGQDTLNFVRAYKAATGKRVVFVASGNDQPLSFTGVVRKGDPNTIFLDAHGDRNILALLGHEWSHTLEHTRPELHAEMIGRMKPLIIEWAKQEGILANEIGAENVTNEMVANIAGDAISNENFWIALARKNPSLFEKVRDAVLKFLDQFIGKVRKSEFGTEAFIKNAVQMREIVADIMHRASQGTEATPAGAGVSFAPSREEVSFANRRTEKGFYSKLEGVVVDKIPKTASPEQVKATINGAGIKAEEIKWSGVMPKIDEITTENQGKVPKAELVTHLENEGSVQFKEVTLAEKGLMGKEAQEMSDLLGAFDRTPEQQARLAELSRKQNEAERPRYATYVLPGGKNYREVVLAMPSTDARIKRMDELKGLPHTEENIAEYNRLSTETQGRAAVEYTSSHFPNISNYVAHMRLNEREGGLFIEEIQSDRHQAGREKGYIDKDVDEAIVATETARNAYLKELSSKYGEPQEVLGRGISLEWLSGLTSEERDRLHQLNEAMWKAKGMKGAIPDAPFRSDWHMAMFKRALRDAVATGKEWIGWTTGQTQYDRWGSEKFDWEKLPDKTTVPHEFGTPEEQADAYRRLKEATDAVVNTPVNSPAYPQAVKEHEMAQQAMIDLVPGWGRPEHHAVSWRLSAQEQFQGEAGGVNMEEEARQRGLLLEEKGTRVASFEDVLGVVSRVSRDKDKAKGMAEKLWKKMQEKDSGTSLPRKEGMEYFYDTAMPSAVGKYVKQWGGKVDQGELDVGRRRHELRGRDRKAGSEWRSAGFVTDAESAEDQLRKLKRNYPDEEWEILKHPGEAIWKIEITPQMKTGVTEGQVMFAPRREAAKARGKRTVAGSAFAGRRAAAVEAEIGARTAEPEGRVAFFQKIRDRVLSLIKENDTRREGRLPPERIDPANELARLDNTVRAKMEGIDRREQAELDKIALRVLSQFNAPADTGAKLQDLENQRQSEIEAAERDWQKTFSRENKNISDLTFQQRLVTFERIRGLERQYKERLRGIRNVYRERGRALLQAVATDKAAAETAIKSETRLASEVEKRFDVERREAERQHELRQKQIEQRAELRTKIGQQAFESKEARRRLIESIGEFNAMLKALPEELRGKIGGIVEVAKITDEEDMAKFFAQRIARIDEVLEHHLKTEYQGRIETLLKVALPKKGASGVVKSRVGPDAQALVARVLPYTEKSGETVETRLNQIELTLADSTQTDKLSPEQISALVIEQEELSQYGALKEQSAESLAATHAALKQTLRSGRSALSAKEEARLADQRAKALEIAGRLPAASQSGIKEKNQKVLKNFFSNFLRSHYSLAQMLGQIIPNAPFLQEWQEVTRRQTMADYDFVLNTTTELSKLVRQAIGKNSSVAAGDALAKMKELTIVGPKGKVSKLDAIHYVMAWKQRDVQTRMEDQGWTKEHIDALNAELSDPVSQALMKFFRQKYDFIYQKTNEVYRRMYGMDLPKNPNYVPMRYEHGALELESDPTGGPLAISGLTPSAIKGRVAHNSEMQQVDALDVFLQHLNQMSHWLHTAELNREMRGVLTNVESKKALKQHLGQDGYQMVLNQMDAIARNGSARAGDVKAVTQAISFVASGKAITALAFNLHSLVMQFDSAMRFMLAIPASRWVPLLANPKSWANFSTAWHSDTVQRRIIGGMAPDVQFAMQANNLTPSSLLALTRAGMLPINYADAFATSVSSAIVYTDAINQGASHEVALDRMDAAVARFSQPTVLSSKSGMETTSSAALKLFMMFMSDARLKTGILWEAIGDIRNGKNIGMAIQRILVVEAMSLLAQLVASVYAYMLSDDDDDPEWYGDLNGYLRALFAAPLQGLIFVGSIAEATASWVFGTKLFPKTDPFVDVANKFRKAGKHLPDITRPFEDPAAFLKEVENLAKATGSVSGPAAGLPALVGQAAKWTGEVVEK